MHRLLMYKKKRTRKRTKKKSTPSSRKICIVSEGKKKKGKQILQSLGALIICKATPLCLLFFFCSLLKRLTPSLGEVIICTATSLCLLAAHMPTVVEIIVPQLPVPAQPVVCLCNNKNKKKCRKKNMCRSSQPVVCL